MQDKLTLPVFPSTGHITNWLGAVATALQAASGYWDGMEIPWLYDCRTKSEAELATEVLRARAKNPERWVRMDNKLAPQMLAIIRAEAKVKQGDPITEEITLKNNVSINETQKP